jgi:inositol-1,3,4-trisphosphate 5/6-kinase/inositol-tetrakisphosphate 1-kinase
MSHEAAIINMLQEFVNHGGVLFKVYIVGDTIKVVRRFSSPDVDESDSNVQD